MRLFLKRLCLSVVIVVAIAVIITMLSGCANTGDSDTAIDSHYKIKFCMACLNLDWDHKSTHDVDESDKEEDTEGE